MDLFTCHLPLLTISGTGSAVAAGAALFVPGKTETRHHETQHQKGREKRNENSCHMKRSNLLDYFFFLPAPILVIVPADGREFLTLFIKAGAGQISCREHTDIFAVFDHQEMPAALAQNRIL